MLCSYGCGREAKFHFKNGKWCCSTHFSKCPKQRKGNSLRIKEIWDEPNSVYDSILRKENLSNSIKKFTKIQIANIIQLNIENNEVII